MCRKILCSILLIIGLNGFAFADDYDDAYDDDSGNAFTRGFSLGAQIGGSHLHYDGSAYTKADSKYDNAYRLAGRGFIAYNFSQFISLELGYDYWGRPKFEHTSRNTQDILQQGMDLMVKANLPLDYGFALYIKGGLAWVHRSTLNSNGNYFVYKDSNDKYPPVGAIGINYWFIPNMAIDLCWTKTMSVGDLPTMDMFTAGFIYRLNI